MAVLGWRLARGRGKQLSLAACFLLSGSIAFLGRADADLFDNFRAGLSDFAGPVLSAARAPLTVFEGWVGGAATMFTVYSENQQLKRENAELLKWQDVALSLEHKMKRYETLLNAMPDPKLPSVTARVVGESNRPFIRTMILDAGTAQDVKKGQAVIDERGLIGRVFVTGERTSWVILLSDLNSRVPVVVESSHRRAIMAGDNTPMPHLELDVGDGPVRAGDRILSTGDGGLLPPDLPIGVVMNESGELRVALYANPDASDFVRVLNYSLPPQPPASPPADGMPVAAAASNPPAAQTNTAALTNTRRPAPAQPRSEYQTVNTDSEPVEEDR